MVTTSDTTDYENEKLMSDIDTKASSTNNNQIRIYEKWDEYNLKSELLRGIYGVGFDSLSYVQKAAIAPIIERRNLRAQAQSGTGKTAAFGIGALQRLSGRKVTEVLIIVNTHEMAAQNCKRINDLAKYMDVNIVAVSGGVDVRQTAAALRGTPEIVVGTPGRLTHMIRDGYFDTSTIDLIVVDEADEMLKSGFHEQMTEIFMYLPATAQIVMFSATWEKDVAMIADDILEGDSLVVDLRDDEQTLKGITQYYVALGQRPRRNGDSIKFDVLYDIYSKNEIAQCIIFVNTKKTVRYLYDMFTHKNTACSFITGELQHTERAKVLDDFSKGTCRLLIATGLVGRGIDIQCLSLVINFDIPPKTDLSNYLHRIGRAGRFGRKGKALNLVFDDEEEIIVAIKEHFRTEIIPLPSSMDLS